MNIPLIASIIVAVLLILAAAYIITLYNHLISLKNSVTRAWANIDVLLKQRHDEIPKLVETCKQYMSYEQSTLEAVMRARQQVYKANEQGDIAALGQAESVLRLGLGQLFAVAEDYPDLHTDSSFQHLQTRISELETNIADRREYYNDAVTLWNTRIEQFPDLLIARQCNFKLAHTLQFSNADTSDVDLNNLFN